MGLEREREMAKKAKKGSAAGQRSKKKHANEVKRKDKPSTRPSRFLAPEPPAKPRFGWLPAAEGIEGLAARVGIHYYEAACNAADHAGATPNLLPSVVMIPSRVAALGTPALLARLAALGVVTDQDAFLATIGAEVSAVKLANDVWIPHLAASTTVHDRDFVRLAACELWKRLRPETPSTEGLLDLLHRGFDHARRDDDPAAVEIWLDFWTQLRKLLPPEARTLKAVDGFFGKDFKSFDDWIELLLSSAESAETFCFMILPILNFTAARAGMAKRLPGWLGLRPPRGLVRRTSSTPKLRSSTLSFFASASVI